MKTSRTIVGACALLLASAAAFGAPKPIEGSGGTSGGAATYELKIEIPPGDGSLRPTVALHYSSRRGNGDLGMGWSGYGAGSVFRCPAIIPSEGYAAQVAYAADDRLGLDGEHLIAIEGEYGKEKAVYSTEIESDQAVVQLGGALNDAQTLFAAAGSNESVRVYAQRQKPLGAGVTLYWHQTALRTKSGRSIDYVYEDLGRGEVVLTEIWYAGQRNADNSWTGGPNFVRFTYAPRTDVASTYIAGGQIRQSRLLTGIVSGTREDDDSESIFSEYTFDYRPSRSSGRMLLERVSGCVTQKGKRDCRTPTRITWNDEPVVYKPPQDAGLALEDAIAPAWRPGEPVPAAARYDVAADFDADGRSDVAARAPSGRTTIASFRMDATVERRTPVPAALAVPPLGRSVNRDVRHLGAADLIGDLDGRLAVSGWRTDGFATPEKTVIPATGDFVGFDASGDGQDDLLVGARAGADYVVTLYRNDGSDPDRVRFAPGQEVARVKAEPGMHLEHQSDIDGSGRTVLLRAGSRIAHLLEFRSAKDGSTRFTLRAPEELAIARAAQDAGLLFADLNGDGLAEIVYVAKDGHWMVQQNVDGRFAPPSDTGVVDERGATGRAGTIVVDYDADGIDELLFPARRIADFCIEQDTKPLCGDELAALEPRMDFGLYEYDALRFALDADDHYRPTRRGDLKLVAQANRTRSGDLDGDGYADIVSAFDRGVANGRFRATDGTLGECPPRQGCGLHLVQLAHVRRDDRRDTGLDMVLRVERDARNTSEFHYFPLSNPVRALYSVPPLGSPQRFIDTTHFYFRSSMFVVGDEVEKADGKTTTTRWEYGAAQYDTQGRGMDGFKWLVEHDEKAKTKVVSWYRQLFPFRGELERVWVEAESDVENDYLVGSPGKSYIGMNVKHLTCAGPADHPASRRFGCSASKLPVFRIASESQQPGASAAKAAEAAVAYVDAEKFRATHPAPAALDKVRAAFEAGAKRYLERTQAGGRTQVVLHAFDGKIYHGSDEVIAAPPGRLHEMRNNYEAIAVGQRACTRPAGEKKWKCSDTGVSYGFTPVEWDAVARAEIEEIDCDGARCARVVVVQADVLDTGTGVKKVFAPDAEASGHRYELVMRLSDDTPLTLRTTDTTPGRGSATSDQTFEYDAKVGPIELPE